MMYVDYPRLLPTEQLQGLEPLQPPDTARLQHVDLPLDQVLSRASIEMMAGRPVLRITPAMDSDGSIEQMRITANRFDLLTGAPFQRVPDHDLQKVAATFGRYSAIRGGLAGLKETPVDQWTVQTFRSNAPLMRADYADPAGTQIYISATSGEVVQQTTRGERFWGWLGAVPHWLYPTLLRQNGPLWSQVVIWTSLIGCFLTLTGLWAGIARLRRKRDGTIGSRFRGIWWWHHIFGLWFGALTLTWVASGLFSMNPWGFLDSMAGFNERQLLAGRMDWKSVRQAFAARPQLPEDTVRLDAAPLGGRMYLAAITRSGRAFRFDHEGRARPLDKGSLKTALADVGPVSKLDFLTNEDGYYYRHKYALKLPVWRAILADPQETRIYIDPDSGTLIRAIDRDGRRIRWLVNGLHSLDLPVLRTRPLWDLIVLPLLAMVTLICATGTWMGVSKLRRDVRRWRRRRRGTVKDRMEDQDKELPQPI